MREARKVKEVNNMTVLIALAIVFYIVSTIAIAILLTTFFGKIEMYSPKSVIISSLFWIVIIPVETIYLVMTKKGNRVLTEIFELFGI